MDGFDLGHMEERQQHTGKKTAKWITKHEKFQTGRIKTAGNVRF